MNRKVMSLKKGYEIFSTYIQVESEALNQHFYLLMKDGFAKVVYRWNQSY